MKYISDSGIKMCWATVFYFMKTDRVRKIIHVDQSYQGTLEFL